MIDHLSDEALARYRRGNMDPAELIAADDHLEGCALCASKVFDDAGLRQATLTMRRSLTTAAGEHLTWERLFRITEGSESADPAVTAHIEECDMCRAELEDLRQFRNNAGSERATAATERGSWISRLRAFWAGNYQGRVLGYVAAALFIAILGVAYVFFSGRPRPQVAGNGTSDKPRVESGSTASTAEPPSPTSPSSTSAPGRKQLLPTATLLLVSTRDAQGTGNLFELPSVSQHVKLEADVSGYNLEGYSAILQGQNGTVVYTFQKVKLRRMASGGEQASMECPARVKLDGTYVLMLYGIAPDGKKALADAFTFQVIRK